MSRGTIRGSSIVSSCPKAFCGSDNSGRKQNNAYSMIDRKSKKERFFERRAMVEAGSCSTQPKVKASRTKQVATHYQDLC